MNSHPQKKSGAAASTGLDGHLPAPPNELLREWIRAVDLQPAQKNVSQKQLSKSVAGSSQLSPIPIHFLKPKSNRVKVSFAKIKSPP